jgi:hypothetical protein
MKFKVYSGINKKLIEKASKLEESKEFDLTKYENTIYRYGVKLHYIYDPDTESSTVTILKKPYLIPYNYIWSRLDNIFEKIKNL